MTDHWILDGREAVPADLMTWARWYEEANRRVARTKVGEADVSTVFLGIDHGFAPGGRPLLFETMVFGGPHDQFTDRYATWDEAAGGHEHVVAALEAGEQP